MAEQQSSPLRAVGCVKFHMTSTQKALSLAFPSLHKLSIEHNAIMPSADIRAALWKDLTALQLFAVVADLSPSMESCPFALGPEEFAVLAMLPNLSSTILPATAEHIHGVSQLHHVHVVCSALVCRQASTPPTFLQSIAVTVAEECTALKLEGVLALKDLTAAALQWLT